MDNKTPQQRHYNMSKIRSKDTKPELLLRRALWHAGIRYRKNYTALPGKPDIVILKYHIAIFIDGDFWHGNPTYRNKQVKTHTDFWIKKINTNILRDQEINDVLTEMGWLVLRFWESDVKKDLNKCLQRILAEIPQ